MYSCYLCGLRDIPVEVRYRAPGEGVVEWVELVIALTGADHARRSPTCRPQELHDLKIPLPPGSDSIGFPPKH